MPHTPHMDLIRPRWFFHRKLGVHIGAALIGLALAVSAGAADERGARNSPRRLDTATPSQEKPPVWMTIGTTRLAVILEDNPTAAAFMQLLPATFDMTELNGNEKYVRLPRGLPSTPMPPGTIRTGDILLYGDNTVVLFYASFQTSYSYTRVGRVVESDGLAKALGPGNPRLVFTAP